MGSSPITCSSVTHSVWTTRGMQRPQCMKSISSVRVLERGVLCILYPNDAQVMLERTTAS
jgi:hypothetical protein